VQSALWLWQSVFIIIFSSLLFVRYFAHLFIDKQPLCMAILLPDNVIVIHGQSYKLTQHCRKSFLGCWLNLTSNKEVSMKPELNLFIPQYQLSRQQSAYLSYIIKST